MLSLMHLPTSHLVHSSHAGFSSLLEDAFDDFFLQPSPSRCSLQKPRQPRLDMRLDVQEDDQQVCIVADLPGVPKEGVHVEVKDRVLTIQAERESAFAQAAPEAASLTAAKHDAPDAAAASSCASSCASPPTTETQPAQPPQWTRVERSYGRVVRRVRLPDTADVDSIAASLQDGVLRLAVPKVQPPQPRRIPVQ